VGLKEGIMNNVHARFRLATCALVVLIFGCTSLIGGYNATSQEQLTSLKAAHLKFIDDYTAGEGKTYDETAFDAEAGEIDLKFREALEFASALGDSHRVSNIELLMSIFKDDLDNMRKKSEFLTAEQAVVLKNATTQAYEAAIKGEKLRPDSPN
jgi:hypothetical protein